MGVSLSGEWRRPTHKRSDALKIASRASIDLLPRLQCILIERESRPVSQDPPGCFSKVADSELGQGGGACRNGAIDEASVLGSGSHLYPAASSILCVGCHMTLSVRQLYGGHSNDVNPLGKADRVGRPSEPPP